MGKFAVVYPSGFSASIHSFLISNVEALKSSAMVRFSISTGCSVDLKFCMQFFGWTDVSDAVTLSAGDNDQRFSVHSRFRPESGCSCVFCKTDLLVLTHMNMTVKG